MRSYRGLYDEMMLSETMAVVAKGVAGLGALFYVALKVMAGIEQGRANRRFSLAETLCNRHCVLCFSDHRARYYQWCTESNC
jgi:hypothetical protein